MGKKSVLFFIFLYMPFLISSPTDGGIFSNVFLGNAMHGEVLSVRGLPQFFNVVLRNKKPVVVCVVPSDKNGLFDATYRDIAKSLRGRALLVDVNTSYNENKQILTWIMGQLRIVSISIPFFLFFKGQKLVSLPVPFRMFGVGASKKMVNDFKMTFINYVKEHLVIEEGW